MPRAVTTFRIFVASPSDLEEEVGRVNDVVRELNITWPDQRGVALEVMSWKTHAFPAAGGDPQQLINQQIPPDYDIFLGMLWTKVGAETPRSRSGTLEEFQIAYDRASKHPESLQLMIYFKTAPVQPDQIDPDQLKDLLQFRKSLTGLKVLYWTFETPDEFAQLLRVHLSQHINRLAQSLVPPTISTTSSPSPRDWILRSPVGVFDSPEAREILSLADISVAGCKRVGEIIDHFKAAVTALGTKTEESTREMNMATHDPKTRAAALRRVVSRQAEVMTQFASGMRPEISFLDNTLTLTLDLFGQIIAILPDFGPGPQVVAATENALKVASQLYGAILQAVDAVRQLDSSFAGLPSLSPEFVRARNDVRSLLRSFIDIHQRGLNILREIEHVGASIVASWNVGPTGIGE